MSRFEFSLPVGMGVGERTFYMPEQFAFKQRFSNGTHIHRYHIAPASFGKRMDFACQHFLPGTILSGNQDICICLGYLLYQCPQLFHGIAFTPIH